MKYLRYIYESSEEKFEIGDIVMLIGIVDNKNLDGIIGTILDVKNSAISTNMKDGNIVETYNYKGKIYFINKISWWVSPYNMKSMKNLKKIEKPDIDPYGEEDWGYVQERRSI